MAKTTYHHGNLAPALLAAAETILEREGLPGLTLRAIARAAGVSHAAPAHHFGDLTGLLSALATSGYVRFREHQLAAMDRAGADGPSRFKARGAAYVSFAQAHPHLFMLMFRSDRLDWNNEALRAAAEASFGALTVASTAATPAGTGDLDVLANAMAAWSLVHGFASLMIDGRLPKTVPPDALLDAVLSRLVLRG